jgi:hypothetical protein
MADVGGREAEIEAVVNRTLWANLSGEMNDVRIRSIAAQVTDAVRSSGSAAEWEARYLQQKQRGDSLEAALDSAEAALARSSGSAAQNQEENSGQKGMRAYLEMSHRPSMAARSPQDEDHDLDDGEGWQTMSTICEACGHVQGSPQDEDHERLRAAGDALADAIRGLDSYAASSQVAPLERSERAAAALAAWEETA